MSSEKFEVRIRPDPLARGLVVGAGIVLTLAGGWILASAQLPPPWRALCLVIWTLRAMHEFRGIRLAFRRVDGICIDADGGVAVISPGGERTAARFLTGSFATPAVAWFRLRLPGGCRYGEFLIRQRTPARDWHRLQLAWQLGRRTFGHRGRA